MGSFIDFGTRLEAKMHEYGISQETLAKICHTTQQTVSRWCKGKCEPDIENLFTICVFFGESLDSFFGFHVGNAKQTRKKMIQHYIVDTKGFMLEQMKIVKEADKLPPLEMMKYRHEKETELLERKVKEFCSEHGFDLEND